MSKKPESNKSDSTHGGEERSEEQVSSKEVTERRARKPSFTDHKPPPYFLTDGGSFILEAHNGFPDTSMAHTHPKRRRKYQDARRVEQIRVTDLANNTIYLNGHADAFRIKVWLVNAADAEPEVIFGGNPLVVEVDQDLGRHVLTGNKWRGKRFKHPNAAVTIKKIIIENNAGEVFFRAHEHPDNGFQILIWVEPEP